MDGDPASEQVDAFEVDGIPDRRIRHVADRHMSLFALKSSQVVPKSCSCALVQFNCQAVTEPGTMQSQRLASSARTDFHQREVIHPFPPFV